MGIAPGLGRQDLDALCQQHGCLALHLNTVLEVFDHLDAIRQLDLQQRERLARQRRARLGGVALPRHGICNIELRSGQQSLGLADPLGSDGLLTLLAADLIKALPHGTGSALVAAAQLFEHLLQLLWPGLGGKPVPNARCALARCRGRKNATGQSIQRMRLMGFGRGRIHFGCVRHFVAGEKGKHGFKGITNAPGQER